MDESSLAGAAERLMIEFGTRVSPAIISRVVLDSCADLRGAPIAALPELVERMARQRLRDVTDAR